MHRRPLRPRNPGPPETGCGGFGHQRNAGLDVAVERRIAGGHRVGHAQDIAHLQTGHGHGRRQHAVQHAAFQIALAPQHRVARAAVQDVDLLIAAQDRHAVDRQIALVGHPLRAGGAALRQRLRAVQPQGLIDMRGQHPVFETLLNVEEDHRRLRVLGGWRWRGLDPFRRCAVQHGFARLGLARQAERGRSHPIRRFHYRPPRDSYSGPS